MIRRTILLGLFCLIAGSFCMGQVSIQLPAGAVQDAFEKESFQTGGKLDFRNTSLSGTTFSNDPMAFGFLLPTHVRTNPRGYSPLCRLELRIEDRLPVGVWVKLGEKPLTPSYLRSNAEVRFKLFRF